MVAHTAWTLVISVLAGAIGLTEGLRSVPGLAIVPAHVVSSWTVTARVQCHTLCLYSPYCVSVNWRWKANPAVCDLNKVTESDVPNAVRSDDDSIYIELSAEELSGRVCRCQSSETCVPVRHQGYLCLTTGLSEETTTSGGSEQATSRDEGETLAPPVPTTSREEDRTGGPACTSNFTQYDNYHIKGYNSRTLRVDTVEQCLQACINVKDYDCRSADLWERATDFVCHLSDVTKDDVPADSWSNDSQRVTYYHRTCRL